MRMQNSTSRLDITNNPKFRLLTYLIKECYRRNTTHSQFVADLNEETDVYCPRTFDGFACWDETPAGSTAFQKCPSFIVGFDPKRYAYKKCMENGTWFKLLPEAILPWTNYTTCVNVEDLDFWSTVNHIYVVGYSISVVALILSLVVFYYFRSLQCTRIRIHMHLFTSFAINNLLWIFWYKAVVNNVTVIQDNKMWCQVLHIITHYFMVTGYIWMFCEGLHLHIALVVVFVKDDVAMLWFGLIGWGVPLIIMAAYSTARYLTPGATERCWMDHSDTFWIIVVPVVMSLFTSLIFLVNVVRVLLTKLHPAPNQHASVAAKKAVRAALILIPLFGLHFILIPFRPSTNSPGERFYQVFSALLTSLQGACVAVLFCFTNHDVITATKMHLARYMDQNDGIPMTGVTGGDSMMNTRENIL
ncbi:calcitonin gene-related peptide type 1 receptor-like [Maniola hyperantus]|uniref:calcitonin gene-related peptide type 1 receptor-like n=1 Tax=Aphantopus hyperantus TaxID=2795564 RepID=UPI001568F14E|nr:calcitonin gene-related peptide type 1 receptor-like [Maniola hyperantus]